MQDHLFSYALKPGGSSSKVVIHLDRLSRIVEDYDDLRYYQYDPLDLTHITHSILEGRNQSLERGDSLQTFSD